MKRASLTRRKHHDRRGATAIEFAICAPALFMIIFAMFEFTRVLMFQDLAKIATYEACRQCMVPGSTIEEAEAIVAQKLGLLRTVVDNVTVTVRNKTGPQTQIDDFTTSITVKVDINLYENTFMISPYFAGKKFSSETTMAFESYDGFYDGSSF